MTSELVARFDSDSEAYRDSFETFLRNTDQKVKAREWLDRLVDGLPRREVFIDAGAGEGATTAWIARRFQHTLAIEPNESLRQRLAVSCPRARVLPQTILETRPEARGDFVLCSHVFPYLDDRDWDENLAHLTSWLAPGGVLVLIMPCPTSDCRRMFHRFFGRRVGLGDLMRRFQHSAGSEFSARIDTVPCYINAANLETAYKVAEFIVSTRPDDCELKRVELESYVESEFRLPDGGYRFSCTQDFLVIGRD